MAAGTGERRPRTPVSGGAAGAVRTVRHIAATGPRRYAEELVHRDRGAIVGGAPIPPWTKRPAPPPAPSPTPPPARIGAAERGS
jgi:hypothetical protein